MEAAGELGPVPNDRYCKCAPQRGEAEPSVLHFPDNGFCVVFFNLEKIVLLIVKRFSKSYGKCRIRSTLGHINVLLGIFFWMRFSTNLNTCRFFSVAQINNPFHLQHLIWYPWDGILCSNLISDLVCICFVTITLFLNLFSGNTQLIIQLFLLITTLT